MEFIDSIRKLPEYEGKKIAITGEITEELSTHILLSLQNAPVVNYLRLHDGDVVLYADEELPKTRLLLEAKVIKVEGIGKGEKIVEFQLVLGQYA